MVVFFALFFLLTIMLSGISTIPFSVVLIVVATVIFKKSWIFFAALGIGLFLDLVSIRSLGYTSLVFTVFVLFIWLYERKFETQTITFVFFATFLGSLAYLIVFGYQQILLQSIISSVIAVLLFKTINSKFKVQN